MTLQSLAEDQLDRVTVTISNPLYFYGNLWTPEETAYYRVNVNAGYGDTFRDVRVRFYVNYSAIIDPLVGFGTSQMDGDEYFEVLSTGHPIKFLVRLKSKAAGPVHVWVSVTAEAVPAASDNHIAHRWDTVSDT